MTGTKALRQLDEIAEAGLRCFLRSGYRLTQMADVATALGLSAGAPYRYIESKEALFQVSLLHAAGQEINHIPLPVTTGSLAASLRVARLRDCARRA